MMPATASNPPMTTKGLYGRSSCSLGIPPFLAIGIIYAKHTSQKLGEYRSLDLPAHTYSSSADSKSLDNLTPSENKRSVGKKLTVHRNCLKFVEYFVSQSDKYHQSKIDSKHLGIFPLKDDRSRFLIDLRRKKLLLSTSTVAKNSLIE